MSILKTTLCLMGVHDELNNSSSVRFNIDNCNIILVLLELFLGPAPWLW